jgi:predicted MPP superfamily phosphohydrolase
LGASNSEPRIEIIRPGRWLYLNSPDGFERVRVELPIANLSSRLNGLRILHLTDLHLRPHWWPAYDELHQITRDNPPDLILCTGDFVEHTWKRRRTLPVLQRFIDGLTSRLGVWGILGNHDGDFLMPLLVNFRLHILNRARTLIEANGDAIELIGVPGVHRLDLDDEFLRSLPPRDPGRLRIVMQHYPDQIRRTQNLDADLVLAGHTHGGQICLPGGRPIITHDSLPKGFASGVHRFGKSWMIVGRGLGFATLKVRAFCAPQVVEVVLKSGQWPVAGSQ